MQSISARFAIGITTNLLGPGLLFIPIDLDWFVNFEERDQRRRADLMEKMQFPPPQARRQEGYLWPDPAKLCSLVRARGGGARVYLRLN
jgi:hypothetical protein